MHFLWKVGLSWVAINMSSMYMMSHPSLNSSSKMVFIIIWKVAGELVIPKNMTVGSNCHRQDRSPTEECSVSCEGSCYGVRPSA